MIARPSLIRIDVETRRLSRFVIGLRDALAKRTGTRVLINPVAGGARRSPSLKALLSLEKMVLRRSRSSWSDAIDRDDLSVDAIASASDVPDLVIDLTAEGSSVDVPLLRPLYDGVAGEDALAHALFFSGTPRLTIACRDAGTTTLTSVADGVASLEDAAGLGGAMEACWSRVAILLAAAIGRWPHFDLRQALAPHPVTRFAPGGVRLSSRAVRMVATEAARAAYRLCCHAPHWRIGWRFVDDGQDVWSRRDLDGARWNVLPDLIDHFYADPVPINHQGRDHLFFEDLDHKTGKGIISLVTFDGSGRPGRVEPVLEEPWHLSYPFLIEAEGQIWMVPESSLGGEIALYRARRFPHQWEKHSVLVSGVEAADATIVEHQGRYYMFAVIRDGVGGYSDTLAIWHAHSIFGPWREHAGNPVMVDDRAARPAGNIVHRDGSLDRPVQDCRNGYGAALGLARIDRLDPDRFEQTVETHLTPNRAWPGRKLHTLNRAGRLEVIDGSIIRPRWNWAKNIAERRYEPKPEA